MRKNISFIFLLIVCFYCTSSYSQTCEVTISGEKCAGEELTANTGADALSKLIWKLSGGEIFTADTISSPTTVSTVAGNHGTGSSSNQFKFPAGGIAIDASGNIYVADSKNNRIQKWAQGAATGVTVAGGNGPGDAADQLMNPKDVFVDAGQNIYIADYGNNRIQKWVPGAIEGVTVAGGNGAGASAKHLNRPNAVYVDATGNIYISDANNYRIQRWKPGADRGKTVAGGNGRGTAANQFLLPIDVYLDGMGNIYIADADTDDATHHRVQKWAKGAESGITVAGDNGEGGAANQFGYLLAIAVDAAGNVYAADNGVSGSPIGRIQKWTPGAANGITVAGGHSETWDLLRYPEGVALDNSGNLYVLEGIGDLRVQKYILTNGIVNNKFIPPLPGSYNVQAFYKNGCIAKSKHVVIRILPKVQIYSTENGGRGDLCAGGLDTFFVFKWDDVTSYKWTIPKECSIADNKNDSIILNVPAGFSSGRLIAKGTNVCGTSKPDTVRLAGAPVKPSNLAGPKRVLPNQTNIMYSVKNKNDLYNWTVPADALIVSGQNTSAITVNWGTEEGLISVSASNDCGTSKISEQYISLKGNNVTGQQSWTNSDKNALNNDDVMVFPNPSTSNAVVMLYAKKQSSCIIELKDLVGKTMLRKETLLKPGTNKITLNVSSYARGIYLINVIKDDRRKISVKLVKG